MQANYAGQGEQIVTMVSAETRDPAMSVSTAMTGEVSGSEIKKVKPKVQISEYQKGKVLGQGAFGKVMLAKEIATGREVAIKEVDQATIAKLGKTRHIFREKNLLNEMDHPFIIKLIGTTMVSSHTKCDLLSLG